MKSRSIDFRHISHSDPSHPSHLPDSILRAMSSRSSSSTSSPQTMQTRRGVAGLTMLDQELLSLMCAVQYFIFPANPILIVKVVPNLMCRTQRPTVRSALRCSVMDSSRGCDISCRRMKSHPIILRSFGGLKGQSLNTGRRYPFVACHPQAHQGEVGKTLPVRWRFRERLVRVGGELEASLPPLLILTHPSIRVPPRRKLYPRQSAINLRPRVWES